MTLAVVWNSPWNPILWKAGRGAARIGTDCRGVGVNTQTHSRHGNHWKGVGWVLVRIRQF